MYMYLVLRSLVCSERMGNYLEAVKIILNNAKHRGDAAAEKVRTANAVDCLSVLLNICVRVHSCYSGILV